MESAALERLKNRRHHFFSVAIDPILFKLAGNEDRHNILDEFEFRPDLTTDYGVSCPWASEKIPIDLQWEKQSHYVFSAVFDRILFILAGNEDIHKSLYENFGQIPSLTTELAALECLKNRCHQVISVDIDPIFFKLAGNKDMHNIVNEFEFRPDLTTDYGVSCPWASEKIPIDLQWEKQSHYVFSAVFDRILFILAGNEDIHKSLYENFGQIPSLTTELAALECLKNRCHQVISVDIDPIFFKLAGNKDMHNIVNEFEFRPDRTTDYGVSCPWASKK